MKAKTQRKVRKAVSFVVCISILIGCLSIGQFTVFSAELSGYANETVVLIKNVGSGKYLTVHNGSDANGTNVYQWSSTQGLDQEFRLRYNLEKDCYTINPMCSSDGGNRVLDIVKKNGEIEPGCNVQIYNPIDAEAQEWQFAYYGEGKFTIFPISNIYAVLTANGNSNCTSNGTSASTQGNVYLSELPMSSTAQVTDYQLWYIEELSPGRTVNSGFYKLKNGFNKYMETNSSNHSVYHRTAKNEYNQIWWVEYMFGGYYSIRSADNFSNVLRVQSDYDELGSSIITHNVGTNNPDYLEKWLLWKIVPNVSGGYRIVSKSSFDNQVVTVMYDDADFAGIGQVTYTDAPSQRWTFSVAQCPQLGQTEHAAGHILGVISDEENQVWYDCVLCGARFMSPQEQDHLNNYLTDEDRVIIFNLQRTALLLQIDGGKDHMVEACLRAVDIIRSECNGHFVYDFSDEDGNYMSPINYTYDANSVGANVLVETTTYGEMRNLALEASWIIGGALPYPLNIISGVIESVANPGERYTFEELLEIVETEIYADEINSQLSSLLNAELAKALSYADLLYSTIDFLTNPQEFEKDIVINITIVDNEGYVTHGGCYRMGDTSISEIGIVRETHGISSNVAEEMQTNRFIRQYVYDGLGDYVTQAGSLFAV